MLGVRTTRCVLALLLLTAFAGTSLAQGPALDSDLAAEIDRVVAPYVSARDFMGVVAVQRDGHAPLILTYGLASVELGLAHSAQNVFMIGSVSKQFTAVAILLLAQEGKLEVTDLVSAHLPDFKPEESITIEQLLVHTSGVADVFSLARFGHSGGQVGTFEEVVEDLSQMDLTHKPGAAFAYSNGGYSLLAAIIERASGVTYGQYLADRIFIPLGMTSTFHDGPGPAVRNRVPGYDPWGHDALMAVPPVSAAFTTGSGSLWSSAMDLLTWTEALHTGRLLTASSFTRFATDHGSEYGYGVSIFQRFGRDVVGHDGRIAGYSSDVARYLEDRVTVVILSNVQSNARDEIRRSVAAAVLDRPFVASEERLFFGQSSEPVAELSGAYSFGPGFVVTITHSDGRVLARANEGGYSELIPTSDGAWFSRMLYALIRFERNEEGHVDRMIWGDSAQAPVGRRIH